LYKENGFDFVSLEDALKKPTETTLSVKKIKDQTAIDSFMAWD